MRAVVVGAGISGLSVAGALARNGWQATLLEQAPAPRTAGYMIDFFGPGYDAAARLGALEHLTDYGHLYSRARYVDTSGKTRAQLSMSSFLNAADGKFFSILRPDIVTGLRHWVGSDVNIIQSTKVVSLETGHLPTSSDAGSAARVLCQDGQELSAELLIGADGIHSTTRSALLNGAASPDVSEDSVLRYLGFYVFGYIFSDPLLAAKLGSEIILTDSLERQVGLYALPDSRIAFFGVTQCSQAHPSPELRKKLFDSFAGLGADIDLALARRPPNIFEDVVAQAVVPRWSRGRFIILGDAAYAVSLLAGQGASLAIAGAEALARMLREEHNNIALAFQRFEAQWRPLSADQQEAGRRNARFFIPPHRTALVSRRAALHLINFAPLNRIIARRAFGTILPSKAHRKQRTHCANSRHTKVL